MKSIIIAILLIFPAIGYSQFGHSEFYLVGRFGFGMGMNSYTYFSNLEGTSGSLPTSIQIDLGSGMIPEVGVGLKLTDFFYFESSVFYTKSEDFYSTTSSTGTTTQGYSFNRYAILLNGKYYVPVNEKFVMDFFGGMSITIPQELIVKIGGFMESINYSGSNGLQAGFSGNYILGSVSTSFGIRYRLERFTIKENQDLPVDFETLNPSFEKISSSGIDVVFSIQYNF
ncbi:MAG: hypothetical protein ACPGRC_05580 [Salibacteraceae bacterium]